MILSDRKWNRHMVEQILSNAVKYSYPGKEIEGSTQEETQGEIQKGTRKNIEEEMGQKITDEIAEESSNRAKNVYITITSEKQKVILTIKDEGIGIPSYDMKRIFEPFFTGENGRKQKNASGIGLYFCKEISEMLGCMLQVDSEENKGTTVTITYLQAGTIMDTEKRALTF